MNSLRRIFLVLAAAVLAALSPDLAAQSPRAASLSGRVTDAGTGLALAGARVAVEGAAAQTFTDSSGEYTLLVAPEGAQQVRFSYIGYSDLLLPVTIEAGGAARLDAVFGTMDEGTVRLDEYVIKGAVVGTARAINQQRAAATLTSIVASDEIGRFPDQNAAESLQRLPGVSLYRDQGEGRFVDLRGLNYIYTSVTLNGAKVASPEVGDRAIALDVVPADTLASLEVTKVPTPDMDGEGLGGVVNIRSKSAFDETGFGAQATVESIYSKLADKFGGKINASVSDVVDDGKLGFLISATWQERQFGSRNYEIDDGWTGEDGDGEPLSNQFLQDIAFRDYEIVRRRYGAAGNLEFRPNAQTRLTVNGTYHRFTDSENRHVTYIPFGRGTITELTEDSATVTGVSRPRRDLRNREKDQDLRALSVDGETTSGAWTFDGRASTSRGHEEKPGELLARFRRNSSDGSYRYVFDGTYSIDVTQLAGADIADPASYNALDRLELSVEEGTETENNAALNARWEVSEETQTYVKFGAAYRAKTKKSEGDVTRFEDEPADFTFAALAGELTDYPYGIAVPQIDPKALTAAFYGNLDAFTPDPQIEDSVLDDWTSHEKILAGYLMAGRTFGRTALTAGVRIEKTDFDTDGFELDDGTPLPVSASHDYTNVLPGVYLRHEITPSLVVRASYSTSIMRAAFGETALRRNINTDDNEVTQGNPELEPLESRNWDASIEYYLPSLGVVSAGAFHKQIDNFTYEFEVDEPVEIGGELYELTTFDNGSDGRVTGLELAYQQQLRFLPEPFDGLGFMANLTLADSEATYPVRPDEKLPFVGQSDVTGNVALTYEKGRFFSRLALNYRSKHLREDEPIGGSEVDDRWIDDYSQLDLSASYRFSAQWEVFAEATNLTNEPFRVFQRGGELTPAKRFVQFEEYDWTATFGLRWRL